MKTLESYDQVPYESFAISETHPDYLACIGRMLGLESAPPGACRVLELGSAAGGNLIPMAYHLPSSDFVGVELSAEQAQRGQSMIAELGLRNCRLIHGNIMDLNPEPDRGLWRFDYILVHGVYSWVAEPVREHILSLCAGLLADKGIAYLSWNTLPGWHQRGMLREMLLYHCRDSESAHERIHKARELLALLLTGLGERHPESELLRREALYLLDARESYLFHEYLAETNAPELFSDFLRKVRRRGLRYLADARLHTAFPSTLGPGAQSVLARFQTQSQTEQYMDFLTLRPFRRSLLVRSEEHFEPNIDLGRLRDFGAYSALRPVQDPQLDRAIAEEYKAPDGTVFAVERPLTKLALGRLAAIHPNALPVRTLLFQAKEEAQRSDIGVYAEGESACLEELFNLYCSGALGLTMRETVWPIRIRERPQAIPLARVQALAGEGHAASVRHRVLSLDWLSGQLLFLLDGTRDLAALAVGLKRAIRDEPELAAPFLSTANIDAADDAALTKAIGANIKRLLGIFARNGLLT